MRTSSLFDVRNERDATCSVSHAGGISAFSVVILNKYPCLIISRKDTISIYNLESASTTVDYSTESTLIFRQLLVEILNKACPRTAAIRQLSTEIGKNKF